MNASPIPLTLRCVSGLASAAAHHRDANNCHKVFPESLRNRGGGGGGEGSKGQRSRVTPTEPNVAGNFRRRVNYLKIYWRISLKIDDNAWRSREPQDYLNDAVTSLAYIVGNSIYLARALITSTLCVSANVNRDKSNLIQHQSVVRDKRCLQKLRRGRTKERSNGKRAKEREKSTASHIRQVGRGAASYRTICDPGS